MNGAPEPVGTIEVALGHAGRLLESEPALAAEQAREILRAAPNHPLATLFIGIAQRRLGDAGGALEILQPLARAQPGWAPAHYELGVTLGLLRRGDEAVQSLRQAVRLKPDIGDAWRLLGDHLHGDGRPRRAPTPPTPTTSRSRRATRACSRRRPRSARTASPRPRRCCKQHLKQVPDRRRGDPHARRGRGAARAASRTPRSCSRAASNWRRASRPRGTTTRWCCTGRTGRSRRSREVDRLLAVDPRNPGYRNLQGGRAQPDRRVRAVDRDLRGSARRVPAAGRRSG